MNIYNSPDLYDAIHKNYIWDNRLIKNMASKSGGPVLELASGTGRLTKIIIDLKLDYTGIDLSDAFIKKAKKNFSNGAKFYLENMQNFNLLKKFKFIFIGFNSFLHNLTDKSAKSCLSCVYKHLDSKGLFLISLYIPNPSFLFREPNKLYSATDYFLFNGNKCRIMEKNDFDQKTQINELTWYLEKNGVLQKENYNFSQRMYYPHMMDLLFDYSGLKIKEKLGDYDGSPMDSNSEMQIYICEKN